MDYAIEAHGVVKRFGATTALRGVDLRVRPGTVLGLLGPNGAGKTTMVRVLATLLEPDAGAAHVGGFDLRRQPHQVRRLIGLTGQYASVDEKLTGRENLQLLGRLLGLGRGAARQRAAELLADFQLSDAADRAAKSYSGGMRRRLDLAASLVGRPRILFLDEPTTGLDPRARLDLWALIRRLLAEGTTVLLTTQYLEEADQLADDLVVIDRGRVIAADTPARLKAQIGSQVLVVRAPREADVAAIAGALRQIGAGRAEIDGLQLSAAAADPALLPALVRELDRLGIAPSELLLRSASLDDVFLALTGQRTEDEAPSEELAP